MIESDGALSEGTKVKLLKDAILIDGEWQQADSGEMFSVSNPATCVVLGSVPRAGRAETRRAIAAASKALPQWRARPVVERYKLLRDYHDCILDHQSQLAELLTAEQGKPLAEANNEIAMSAAYILWFAEEARRAYGDMIPSPWAERRLITTRNPVGVVAAITPWNFPASMLARKIGPALAVGCTTVVKPASQTPLSALALGALALEVGFPHGTINIITGRADEIGDEICKNPSVRKISFTGSTETGKKLIERSASGIKHLSMELGGNAPFIVFSDADIDRAVKGAIQVKFRNTGQMCFCTNRFLIQDEIQDQFIEKFAAACADLKVGSGSESTTQVGPLIDDRALDKVEMLIADACQSGAQIIAGGKRHKLGGTFFEPTIISHVGPNMKLANEEIFGPVAPIFRFKSEEDAIELANDTPYGLAAYAYTSDLSRTLRIMDRLEFGIIGINESLITTVEAPFGGIKDSGLGREGGREGINAYLETKYVCMS